MLSNSQIDKLGDRLRRGTANAQDIELLESYRYTFVKAHDLARDRVESSLDLRVSSRSTKTKASIVAKVRRSRTRLSRMQDIAGLRMVLVSAKDREATVQAVAPLFPECKVSEILGEKTGYRAVHVITAIQIMLEGRDTTRFVEIQIRTLGEHLWAQCSEAVADVFGAELKYGNGETVYQSALCYLAEILETLEQQHAPLKSNQDLHQQFFENFGILRKAMSATESSHSSLLWLFSSLKRYAENVHVLEHPLDGDGPI